MDCVAAVLLCKLEVLDKEGKDSWDLAALNMRKFCALCRSPVQSTTDHKECVEDLWGALKPELQKVTSLEELSHIIQILSSNRFGHGGNSMQLMFAGSMFEHSCLPNCFLGTWATSDHAPQTYRALRDIEKGEALSIDYLNFPLGYCPVSARAQSFQNWGFTCSCLRQDGWIIVSRPNNPFACVYIYIYHMYFAYVYVYLYIYDYLCVV